MTQSTKSISPSRQLMIDDLLVGSLAPETQRTFLRAVERWSLLIGEEMTLNQIQRLDAAVEVVVRGHDNCVLGAL